MDEKCVKYNQ